MQTVVRNSETLTPVGTFVVVIVKLNPLNKSEYYSKLSPKYLGPWVVVERLMMEGDIVLRALCSKMRGR